MTVRLPNDPDIPVGGTFLILNDAAGNLTIDDFGTTLEWVEGNGAAPTTGNRTLARNSICTVRKKSSTVWQVWGNGLT
jgi:hypothetical protein